MTNNDQRVPGATPPGDGLARPLAERVVEVAAKVEGRDRTQCRQRWKYTLSYDIKKGLWSPSEDKHLLAIVKKARTDTTTAGIKWKKDSGIRVSVIIRDSNYTKRIADCAFQIEMQELG